MICFRDFSVAWNQSPPVLDALSLEIPEGRILTILGPSGCGKSTILKAVAGLIHPKTPGLRWSGTISGQDPGSTALVFQDLGLLPWKTVEKNIALPILWRTGRRDPETVNRLVTELGLEGHRKAWPHMLSGGLAQRVALARAFALEPRFLLMDEPFSALDALTRERAHETLWNLWKAHRPTVILVTHSVEEAVALGHATAVLAGNLPGHLATIIPGGWASESPDERRKSPQYQKLCLSLRSALEGNRK